jgi:triosephosphate isomerase (TIM)
MIKKYVIANWKMNGKWEENSKLLKSIIEHKLTNDNINVENINNIVICPPSIYMVQCKGLLANADIEYGGQDVSANDNGAYTGEISASMLTDLGCKYVLVGHSERRLYHQEFNELIAHKALKAIANNIIPVVCVGETLEQRKSEQTKEVVINQVEFVLKALQHNDINIESIIIAYEPVWAIGTGLAATAEQAEAVHAIIRDICTKYAYNNSMHNTPSILYGGSVKASNASELFSMPNIDGALVGGASLNAIEFTAICKANV